jgi:hypothetical protein
MTFNLSSTAAGKTLSYEIYCDESRQDLFYSIEKEQASNLCIGGIRVDASEKARISAEIKELRRNYQLRSEYKWQRVSASKLQFYLEVLRLFFKDEALCFRALVVPVRSLDAGTYHQGDSELMFYKFYYQLLLNWLAPSSVNRVFLDSRTDKLESRRDDLLRCLRNARQDAEIKDIQALRSSDSSLLQLADVLTGAVCAHYNALTESPAKLSYLAEVKHLLGHEIAPTLKGEKKFNVFLWSPRTK